MAILRRAGHTLTLLAPSESGRVLVGGGLGEAHSLLPWEHHEAAGLFSEDSPTRGRFFDQIALHGMVLAFTRNPLLIQRLGQFVPRVEAWDPDPPAGSGHVSEWLARPAQALTGLGAENPPPLDPNAEDSVAAGAVLEALPERFLAVHPGSGSTHKNWPAEHFSRVIDAATGGRPWLLVEGPADEAAAATLRKLPGAVRASHLPVRVLGGLLARAGVYLGNDSGISHLAAAYGAPTVALFGPTDPRVWRPVGPSVATIRSPSKSMSDISVEDVSRALAAWVATQTDQVRGARTSIRLINR